jgi:EpsI family protein
MTNRRALLIGAACAAGAGAAFALKPRRRVSLLGTAHIAAIVPTKLDGWSSQDVSDLVDAKDPNGLAAKLYDESVQRTYTQAAGGAQVMMLLAHGDTQSDELQLHRPEVCYPAFGYRITQSAAGALPLAPSAPLPVRRLVAESAGRTENILYWTRLGEYLPVDGISQRIDRLKTSMHGDITDGLLARFSYLGPDPNEAFGVIEPFVRTLIKAIAPVHRSALIGTSLASAVGQA